jgi:hypothetical protein
MLGVVSSGSHIINTYFIEVIPVPVFGQSVFDHDARAPPA